MDNSNVEVTAEQIKELLNSGMSQTAAAEELGIGVGKLKGILKKDKEAEAETGTAGTAVVAETEVVDEIPASAFAKEYAGQGVTKKAHIAVLTAGEYGEYSEANDRYFGRKRGVKTVCTIEEMRALINSGWKPSMIMRKHGINEEEFKQLVWKLSKAELRDRPLKFSIEQDFIEKG